MKPGHLRLVSAPSRAVKFLNSEVKGSPFQTRSFPGGASGKEPAYNAGDLRDAGLIPGSGRLPGGGHATHSSILPWRIPRREEPGGLQFMGLQGVGHD